MSYPRPRTATERWKNTIALHIPGGDVLRITVRTAGLHFKTCGQLTTVVRWSAEAQLLPFLETHALLCKPEEGTSEQHTHRMEHPTFSITVDAGIVGAHGACDETVDALQHWANSLGALAALAPACDVGGDIPDAFEQACEALGIDLRWRLEQHRSATTLAEHRA